MRGADLVAAGDCAGVVEDQIAFRIVIRAGFELPTTPVFDGMASAGGRLYVALADGSLVCLGAEGRSLKKSDESTIAEFNANAALPTQPAKKPRAKRRTKKAK